MDRVEHSAIQARQPAATNYWLALWEPPLEKEGQAVIDFNNHACRQWLGESVID